MKRVALFLPDGRVLWTYQINFAALNYDPSDDEYFEQARKNAIADKLVDEHEAKHLSPQFVRFQTPHASGYN